MTRITVAATLDGFVGQMADAEGVDLRGLAPMSILVVGTRNSSYRIIVSRGGSVLVEGGRFFPRPTPAVLEGASVGGSFLKVGCIAIGLRMEIHSGGQRIVTSPVRSIVAETVPCSSSVH